MRMLPAVALLMAALMGSRLSAVADGGSLFTFPTLVFASVPRIVTNTPSIVAS